IANTDADENPYEFAIEGFGVDPDIGVLSSTLVPIANNDLTPAAGDLTDFGATNIVSGSITHGFVVTNAGNLVLNLVGGPTVQIFGDTADFTVVTPPAAAVPPGSVTGFQIQFDPTGFGVRTARVEIANDDPDENPYVFAIQGVGNGAEMDVLGTNGAEIVNNDFTPTVADGTDFGGINTTTGTPVTHTFTVTNAGNLALFLNGTPTVGIVGHAADFTVTVQPVSTSLVPTATTTFNVQFMPTALGLRTAEVQIANSDSDEDPYVFLVRGFGSSPEIAILGTNLAEISHADLTPQVADGTDYQTNALQTVKDHVFTVTNSGTENLFLTNAPSVQIVGDTNEFVVWSQPPTNQLAPGESTTFTIRFAPTMSTGTFSALVSVYNDDPTGSEEVYTFRVTGEAIPAASEIEIRGTNLNIVTNLDLSPIVADGTDFDNVSVTGGVKSHTFTIRNTGPGTLDLTGTPRVAISGHTADFTVTIFPSASVGILGGSTTFTIEFDPTVIGVRTALVAILNNDSDEDPYRFAIQGSGIIPNTDIIVYGTNGVTAINHNDTTPSTVDGTDFQDVNVALFKDHIYRINNVGNSELYLTNTPIVEIVGDTEFTVVSQPANTNILPSAPLPEFFTVRFNPTVAGVYSAVVSIASTDPDENPHLFTITGTASVSFPEMDVIGINDLSIVDGDTTPRAADGTYFDNISVSTGQNVRVFCITNTGVGPLVLNGSPRVSVTGHTNDFSITLNPNSIIASGASDCFAIRFDPIIVGVRTALVTISNNDADENPYNFAISGRGLLGDFGQCSGNPVTSLIPNPSFETNICSPTGFTITDPAYTNDIDCLVDWVQATDATTDYMSTGTWAGCGIDLTFGATDFYFIGCFTNQPPDGEFWVTMIIGPPDNNYTQDPDLWYIEYVGADLNAPLTNGVEYVMQFFVTAPGHDPNDPAVPDGDYAGAFTAEIHLIGLTSQPTWPIAGDDGKEDDYDVLAATNIFLTGDGFWEQITMVFTPTQDYTSILL
ncbi:MAG: choice-of-anchor D domain-containing protein, partial [Verrucomicrobiota bacterium]